MHDTSLEANVDSDIGVNEADWKEYNLRSAYSDILDDDAFEYELARFRGLEELKKRKAKEVLEKYAYDKSTQNVARILILCLVYCQAVFGIHNVVGFLLGVVLRGQSRLPRTRLGQNRIISALLLTPVLLVILYAIFLMFKIWLNRVWLRDPGMIILMSLGFVVLFLSLVFA